MMKLFPTHQSQLKKQPQQQPQPYQQEPQQKTKSEERMPANTIPCYHLDAQGKCTKNGCKFGHCTFGKDGMCTRKICICYGNHSLKDHPCKAFAEGMCTKGNNCTQRHLEEDLFCEGKCSNKKFCKRMHRTVNKK